VIAKVDRVQHLCRRHARADLAYGVGDRRGQRAAGGQSQLGGRLLPDQRERAQRRPKPQPDDGLRGEVSDGDRRTVVLGHRLDGSEFALDRASDRTGVSDGVQCCVQRAGGHRRACSGMGSNQ